MSSIHFLWELPYNNASHWPSVSFAEYMDVLLDNVDFAKSTSFFNYEVDIYSFFLFQILVFVFAL